MIAVGRAVKAPFRPAFDTFRWVAPIYFLLLGLAYLLVPAPDPDPVLSTSPLRGAITIVCAIALIWLAEFANRRRVTMGLCSLIAGIQSLFALDNLRLGSPPGALILFLFALGVLLMLFFEGDGFAGDRQPGTRQPDALGLVLGLATAGNGAYIMLSRAPTSGLTAQPGMSPGLVGASSWPVAPRSLWRNCGRACRGRLLSPHTWRAAWPCSSSPGRRWPFI
jgi:hypothetical protein